MICKYFVRIKQNQFNPKKQPQVTENFLWLWDNVETTHGPEPGDEAVMNENGHKI